jgi:soluble lytic murein transglycosylase-like protein
MHWSVRALAGVWLGCLGAAAPATAQQARSAEQVMVVEEDGKRVFVNDGPIVIPRRPALRPAVLRSAARAGRGTDQVPSREAMESMATEAAEKYRVDPALVHAIIEAESSWDPFAVSSKGARGLMQLMPEKARELGVEDSFDPGQNLEGGVRHLRELLERYDGNLDYALAAYNAGGGAVQRAGGVPNYPETRAYVQKITDRYFSPGVKRRPVILEMSRIVYSFVAPSGKRVFTNE